MESEGKHRKKLFDEKPQADLRMRNFIGGFDEKGEARPLTYEALRAAAERFSVPEAAPSEIRQVLETSRDLFAHSYYEYEFLIVASVWSLFAVEAALRQKLQASGSTPLAKLVRRGVEDGLIPAQWELRLDAGRRLRNGIAHGRAHQLWSFGMAGQVIAASHELVSLLYVE